MCGRANHFPCSYVTWLLVLSRIGPRPVEILIKKTHKQKDSVLSVKNPTLQGFFPPPPTLLSLPSRHKGTSPVCPPPPPPPNTLFAVMLSLVSSLKCSHCPSPGFHLCLHSQHNGSENFCCFHSFLFPGTGISCYSTEYALNGSTENWTGTK